jgi:hypothetical protein
MLISWCVQGQQISIEGDVIEWSVDQLTDTKAGASMVFNCAFESHPGEKIVWIQEGGANINEFLIQGTIGSWPDLDQDGRIVYQVSYMGKSGQIVLSRTGGVLELGMEFMEQGENSLPYVFRISSYSKP